MKNYLASLFKEFETDKICVSDLGILYTGKWAEYTVQVDHATVDENGELHLWAGDPDNGKFAEEILPGKREAKQICDQILDGME